MTMAEQVLKDIKVLVVEDDESNQYLMELILGEFGFSFEIVALPMILVFL